MRSPRSNRGVPNPALRRAERPPYEQLLREIEESSWSAVGRRYGVSDNAIRKWVRQYEREQAARDARVSGAAARGQSKRKNVPTGASASASIFGTAAARVLAKVSPLAVMRRMSSSTGVASALTPLA